MSVEVFDKQDDKEFKKWLKDNRNGYYLNKRQKNEMMLHKVGCWHLGDGEGMNSTTNLKVAAKSVNELFSWADRNGRKINSCSVKQCTAVFIKREIEKIAQ